MQAITINFRAQGAATHGSVTIRQLGDLPEALAGLTYGAPAGELTASRCGMAGTRTLAQARVTGDEEQDYDALEQFEADVSYYLGR